MTDTDRDELANDYARTPWSEILERHDWKRCPCDPSRGEKWEPPGRTTGHTPGAAYTREYGSLYVFTTSTEFEARRPYTKFEAYAVLNHGNDQKAAEAALRRKGFGVFRQRDGDGNQIVQCRGKDSSRKYSYTWPG